MNIVSVIHGFPPLHSAGAELTIFSILSFLASQGHECHVISPSFNEGNGRSREGFNYKGIQMHWDLSRTSEEYSGLLENCHCVLTHLDKTQEAIAEAKKHNKPVVHLIHNGQQLSHHRVIPDQASLVVYNSFHLADAVRFPAPSVIVYPPVYVDDYLVDTAQANCYTLVNLNENKGGNLFWNLVRELPDRHFLAQKGSYGEQIIPNILPRNCKIGENNPDMARIYRNTKVLLFPSKSETWGRVGVEAACSGIPIIANPTKGIQEALGENGAIWCRHDDFFAWKRAIESLDDPKIYKKYSDAARSRAFHLEKLALLQLLGLERALVSISHPCKRRVHAIASEPQYIDHLAPTIHALPPENRGILLVNNNGHTNFSATLHHAYDKDLVILPSDSPIFNKLLIDSSFSRFSDIYQSVLLTASWRDQSPSKKLEIGKLNMVRTEHGAGQSYCGSDGKGNWSNPAFIGGDGHKDLLAAFVPGMSQCKVLKAKEKELLVGTIGCPKLDFWEYRRPKETPITLKRVAIAFRYNLQPNLNASSSSPNSDLPPEQFSAFNHFKLDVENLVNAIKIHNTSLSTSPDLTKWTVVGHGHPYAMEALMPWWSALGVTTSRNWDEVLEYSDFLITDTSSIAFEWLTANRARGLAKPLILMDSPEYRKYVDHGLRFWDLEKEELVVSISPGQLTLPFLQSLNSLETTPTDRDAPYFFFDRVLGTASANAKEMLLHLLNKVLPEVKKEVNAKDKKNKVIDAGPNDTQIIMLKTVDHRGVFRKKGGVAYVSSAIAKELFTNNFAAPTSQNLVNPPTLKEPELVNLKDKQSWPVNLFSRLYNLLILPWKQLG